MAGFLKIPKPQHPTKDSKSMATTIAPRPRADRNGPGGQRKICGRSNFWYSSKQYFNCYIYIYWDIGRMICSGWWAKTLSICTASWTNSQQKMRCMDMLDFCCPLVAALLLWYTEDMGKSLNNINMFYHKCKWLPSSQVTCQYRSCGSTQESSWLMWPKWTNV